MTAQHFRVERWISRLEELPPPCKFLIILAVKTLSSFEGRCIENGGNFDVEILLLFTGSQHVALSRAAKLNVVRYCHFFAGTFFMSPFSQHYIFIPPFISNDVFNRMLCFKRKRRCIGSGVRVRYCHFLLGLSLFLLFNSIVFLSPHSFSILCNFVNKYFFYKILSLMNNMRYLDSSPLLTQNIEDGW